jgi:protein required for attachment to host cells
MSWILIANRTGARVLDKQGAELTLVTELSHTQGRLRDRELESDRHGRGQSSIGSGGHTFSTPESSHEHDAKAFAKEIAEHLRQQRMQSRFERLVLVAEPHFLGLVRQALDDVTARLVVATVPKDLASVSLRDLASRLPELPQAPLETRTRASELT